MPTLNKEVSRIRRAGRTRHNIRRLGVNRLSVFRSANHIYAQVFTSCGSKVLASASTLDKEIQSESKHCGNAKAAALTGKLLAARCIAAGIEKLAFDRSGYHYHGRVKALADAAREGGIEF
ncbi:MAG: 50S ribosomal protein L18 [Gammaproteobacteria bacterium]|nr:50S ribosomal protein L18 [Gammaproteobacteria bacterium]